MEEMITITKKEYDKLLHDQMKLIALEGAGVDNWDGYDDAMEILEEMENEEL
jgi:lactate dehydrogenase-like 2-hydroxyacid dehydrogenase